jgi:hypothetical protein
VKRERIVIGADRNCITVKSAKEKEDIINTSVSYAEVQVYFALPMINCGIELKRIMAAKSQIRLGFSSGLGGRSCDAILRELHFFI